MKISPKITEIYRAKYPKVKFVEIKNASDGKAYLTKYYNLDMILAIGYRVKSARGIQFRKWAPPPL
jgi:hypothetical protein